MSRSRELLEEFEVWLQESNDGPQIAEASARKYRGAAKQFVRSVGHPCHVNQDMVEEWRSDMIQEGLAASTINLRISALRALFRFVRKRGMRRDDPTLDLQAKKVPKRLPTPVPDKDLNKILSYLKRKAHKKNAESEDVQDLAIFEILYGSGVRRDEAAHLVLGNIVDRQTLRIVGKGNKERQTILTRPAWEAVRNWGLLEHADETSRDLLETEDVDAVFEDLIRRRPENPLFVTTAGTPVPDLDSPGHFIYFRVKQWADELGIDMSPHNLRHSFATALLNNNVDLGIVADLLGHDDLATAKIYAKVTSGGIHRARDSHPRQVV